MTDKDDACDDDQVWTDGLEVLLDLATAALEVAYEISVAAVPTSRDAQLAHIATLRQVGIDLTTLATACEVIIRRRSHG